MYSGVTHEGCIKGEGVIYDMRVDSQNGNAKRRMQLIFDDYEQSLTIHSSCSNDELVSTMYEIKKWHKAEIPAQRGRNYLLAVGRRKTAP